MTVQVSYKSQCMALCGDTTPCHEVPFLPFGFSFVLSFAACSRNSRSACRGQCFQTNSPLPHNSTMCTRTAQTLRLFNGVHATLPLSRTRHSPAASSKSQSTIMIHLWAEVASPSSRQMRPASAVVPTS